MYEQKRLTTEVAALQLLKDALPTREIRAGGEKLQVNIHVPFYDFQTVMDHMRTFLLAQGLKEVQQQQLLASADVTQLLAAMRLQRHMMPDAKRPAAESFVTGQTDSRVNQGEFYLPTPIAKGPSEIVQVQLGVNQKDFDAITEAVNQRLAAIAQNATQPPTTTAPPNADILEDGPKPKPGRRAKPVKRPPPKAGEGPGEGNSVT